MRDDIFIDATTRKGTLYVWTRNRDGQLNLEEHDSSDFTYLFTLSNDENDTTYKDIYGRALKKIGFKNRREMRDYSDSHDNTTEHSLSPKYKALQDLFHEVPDDIPYNVWYFDIEVDFDLSQGLGYPTPENPYGPINSFQVYDPQEQAYIIFYVYDREIELPEEISDKPVYMVRHENERDLLLNVSKQMDYLDIDVITGWYSGGFDLPYIMARALKLFADKTAKTMFCRHGFEAYSRDYTDDFGNEKTAWSLVGRHHVDLMELYKSFVPRGQKSFSLSNIAMLEINEDKVDYDGDLGKLYREDPHKFFDYAYQDVYLLGKLDEKRQLLQLGKVVALTSCVTMNDILGSVKPIEGGLRHYARERNIILPDVKNRQKEKYEGAIVYDTITGKHKWVFTQDLTSLYPTVIYTLGMSPETMMYQCHGEYTDYIHIMTQDDSHGRIKLDIVEYGEVEGTAEALPSEIYQMITDEGMTISANGTIFSGELGLVAGFIRDSFALRVEYKKLKKKYGIEGDKEKEKLYDLKQQVFKTSRLNATYGICANEFSCIYDIRLAKSITLSAQIISKQQAYQANKAIETIEQEFAHG